jgi:hypothetical protein
MNRTLKIEFKLLLGFIFAIGVYKLDGQDSLIFKGQLSAYTHVNSENGLPWWSGGRYIPQINYKYKLPNNKLLDFEASVNLYGNIGLHPFDSTGTSGEISPHRFWIRYSTSQFELRAGLQKINFGSASILRPLMWFDQIDSRDPLKFTKGVWGLLARYYFMNNANIWLWALYGNQNPKGWELFDTKKNIPEFGAHFQIPVPKGEAGFSYHHRIADCSKLSDSSRTIANVPENRFAIDAKFDMELGWYIEASWSNYNKNIGVYRNQEIIDLGLDYTFRLGKGLSVIYEQLIASSGEKAFNFDHPITFSLLNFTYPISIYDKLSVIAYYDWTNKKSYNFINWQRQFNKITLHAIAYINPKEYYIPSQGADDLLYAGHGLQLMLVYNH